MRLMVLWTDCLVYLLLLMTVILAWHFFHKKEARALWRKVIYQPLHLIAIMILSVYIVIGILDTIHLHATPQEQNISTTGVVSILDKVLTTLIIHSEKTYSAPFATHAYTKESMIVNGTVVRDYPRLVYGGAHLKNLADKDHDIINHVFMAFLQTCFLCLFVLFAQLLYSKYRTKTSIRNNLTILLFGKDDFPWRTFYLTVGCLAFIILAIAELMPYYHIFGTSEIGEDVLYQTLKSVRTGLLIGTLTTLVMLPFALLFGLMAGYFGGWLDDIIQYVYTTLSSIPAVLLIAAAVLSLEVVMGRHNDLFQTVAQQSDARLLALCAILGITSWTTLCRLLRAETLKIGTMDFVQAARSLGVTHFNILLKHLLPNVFHIILITIVLDFSGLVLAEAVLSYVGVGVDPSSYSWGIMINSARFEMARQPVIWWNLSAAFIFMFMLVLAANIISDAMRDAYDPRNMMKVKGE